MEQRPTSTAYEAFCKAQGEFKTAVKDSLNPHFRSKFADFASIYDAVSTALHNNGLYITQPIRCRDGQTVVQTVVRYKDGTEIETSECPVICKVQNDPQAMGSAITYARRYSLASILCVVTDDDDAEAATAPTRQQIPPVENKLPAPPSPTENIRYTSQAPAPIVDLTDWQTSISTCVDAAGLNRIKKDIGAAKLGESEFKVVWGWLSNRAKTLGATYDKENKKFNQA